MSMLDILTIVHSFADIQTASRIRRTCRRLAALTPEPILYTNPDPDMKYAYRVGSKIHRLDGHAVRSVYGSKRWYRGGIMHREYHPQCVSWGYMRYTVNGKIHRETGPSIIRPNASTWYLRDVLHRKTGPADIPYLSCWYTLGKLHRLDGPVYEGIYVTNHEYCIRGVEHSIFYRMDGGWKVDGMFIRE